VAQRWGLTWLARPARLLKKVGAAAEAAARPAKVEGAPLLRLRLFTAHDTRVRAVMAVCVGAVVGAAVFYWFFPPTAFDTMLGPAFVAACAYAAIPLSTVHGRGRAAIRLVRWGQAASSAMGVGVSAEQAAAKVAAAVAASTELGLNAGGQRPPADSVSGGVGVLSTLAAGAPSSSASVDAPHTAQAARLPPAAQASVALPAAAHPGVSQAQAQALSGGFSPAASTPSTSSNSGIAAGYRPAGSSGRAALSNSSLPGELV
jgi:hypothetical protein